MRKSIAMGLVFILLVFVSSQSVNAEETSPILDQANIEITIDNDVYTIKQDVVLSNFHGESVLHSTKEITENKITNVIFTDDEGELTPVIDEGETLHKYTIEPTNNDGENYSYTIEYNVEKKQDEFEVPLFVPEYASSGDDRVVKISFQAPEGNKIQKNSFPNVIKSNQSYVEKDMANVPVIAKYVFSENPTVFHSFNIISFIPIFSLFLLLTGWAIVEKRRGGNQ